MKEAKIIVLAGQSNAVGVGFVKHLHEHFSKEKIQEFIDGYPKILINYNSHDIQSNGFVPVTVGCTEATKDTLGPEVGIADALNERYPDTEIFIVKCALGGANLYNDWLPPSARKQPSDVTVYKYPGHCYDDLVKIMDESIEILKDRGYAPKIKAFCWMQGESDAENLDEVSAYESMYDDLLNDFNETYGEYLQDCRYIDGGISDIWNCYKEMNEVKANYAAKAPNRFFIDTIGHGLTTRNEPAEAPDICHYDSDSVVKLGHLFAEHIEL